MAPVAGGTTRWDRREWGPPSAITDDETACKTSFPLRRRGRREPRNRDGVRGPGVEPDARRRRHRRPADRLAIGRRAVHLGGAHGPTRGAEPGERTGGRGVNEMRANGAGDGRRTRVASPSVPVIEAEGVARFATRYEKTPRPGGSPHGRDNGLAQSRDRVRLQAAPKRCPGQPWGARNSIHAVGIGVSYAVSTPLVHLRPVTPRALRDPRAADACPGRRDRRGRASRIWGRAMERPPGTPGGTERVIKRPGRWLCRRRARVLKPSGPISASAFRRSSPVRFMCRHPGGAIWASGGCDRRDVAMRAGRGG